MSRRRKTGLTSPARVRRAAPVQSGVVAGKGDSPEDVLGWPLILALLILSYLLSLPIYAPASFWPLGYIVWVPWMMAVVLGSRARVVYPLTFGAGIVYYATHLRWLYETTPEGWIANAIFQASYLLPCVLLVRVIWRRWRWPLAVVFPVVWVAMELVRARGTLGFPWFQLGHTQISLLSMVQIADIAGVLGVSFVIAVANGWIADAVLLWMARRGFYRRVMNRRVVLIELAVVLALLGGTIAYGWWRLKPTGEPVAKVAVLQGDYKLSPNPKRGDPTEMDKVRTYMQLMAEAAAQQPDLMVLPETPWGMYMEEEGLYSFWRDEFVKWASKYSTSILVGSLAREPTPAGTYPKEHRYNSAYLFSPGKPIPVARYDKIHLVVFGEYVPFRYSFHRLYRFLNDGPWNPWGRGGFEYSLTAGTEHTRFEIIPASTAQRVHFGVTICYEDVIPKVFREAVIDSDGTKRVDFMLNISNDGWFGHSTQQAQHLVNCAFRAIENRVCVARSANTGISGFIGADGSWHDLVTGEDGKLLAGGTGVRVAGLYSDPRVTFYSRHGDWMGMLCLILALGGFTIAVVENWRRRASSIRPAPGEVVG